MTNINLNNLILKAKIYKVYCYTLGNEFILGEYPELTTAIEKGKEWLGNNIIPNGKNSWKNDDGDKICIEF